MCPPTIQKGRFTTNNYLNLCSNQLQYNFLVGFCGTEDTTIGTQPQQIETQLQTMQYPLNYS